MPDVKGKEGVSNETQQELSPLKWNKDVEGAWRMNVNVAIVEDDNIEECEGNCVIGHDSDAGGSNSESDGEPSEAKSDSDSNSE
jgi:hypothetical protein